MRVFAGIGACSLMVGATAVVGSLVAGARVLLRTMSLSPGSLVFVSPYLDSNPAWLLGPTANRFARIVRVRFDSSAVR